MVSDRINKTYIKKDSDVLIPSGKYWEQEQSPEVLDELVFYTD